jgi:hypothetical protein
VNKSGHEDNALRIWALLTLELWFRTFVDGDSVAAHLQERAFSLPTTD